MRSIKSDQRGFSLVESLVAVLILAIGLLGVAGMNMLGLRGAQDASTRTVATQLSYEIADLVRANHLGEAAYNSNAVISTAAAPPDCVTAVCIPADQALYDLTVWARGINTGNPATSRLPNGQAVVCRDNTPNDGTPLAPSCSGGANDPFVVKLWWDERAMNSTESTQAGSLRVQRFFAMSFMP